MYQKTVIVGHTGRDAEMRYTPSGVPVTDFSSPPAAAGPTPTAKPRRKRPGARSPAGASWPKSPRSTSRRAS